MARRTLLLVAALVTACDAPHRSSSDGEPRAGRGAALAPAAAPPDTGPLTRDEADAFARARYIDGGPPPELMARIAADSVTLDYFAALLDGRAPWPPQADTVHVLVGLASAKRARDVPRFVRFATAPADTAAHWGNVFSAAAGALARRADDPRAARRLRALAGSRNASARGLVISYLIWQPGAASARILRTVPRSAIPPGLRARADSVLAAQASDGPP